MDYEIPVYWSNQAVFSRSRRRYDGLERRRLSAYALTTGCEEWLAEYGGDWGLESLTGEVVSIGEFGPVFRPDKVGQIFQFGDRRTAQLFKLKWDRSKIPKDMSRTPV